MGGVTAWMDWELGVAPPPPEEGSGVPGVDCPDRISCIHAHMYTKFKSMCACIQHTLYLLLLL